jgi:hypothetical protein
MSGLALTHAYSIGGQSVRSDILDPKMDNVAPSELTVDRKVD